MLFSTTYRAASPGRLRTTHSLGSVASTHRVQQEPRCELSSAAQDVLYQRQSGGTSRRVTSLKINHHPQVGGESLGEFSCCRKRYHLAPEKEPLCLFLMAGKAMYLFSLLLGASAGLSAKKPPCLPAAAPRILSSFTFFLGAAIRIFKRP